MWDLKYRWEILKRFVTARRKWAFGDKMREVKISEFSFSLPGISIFTFNKIIEDTWEKEKALFQLSQCCSWHLIKISLVCMQTSSLGFEFPNVTPDWSCSNLLPATDLLSCWWEKNEKSYSECVSSFLETWNEIILLVVNKPFQG